MGRAAASMKIGQAVLWFKYKGGMARSHPEIIPAVVRNVKANGRVTIELAHGLRYVRVENLKTA